MQWQNEFQQFFKQAMLMLTNNHNYQIISPKIKAKIMNNNSISIVTVLTVIRFILCHKEQCNYDLNELLKSFQITPQSILLSVRFIKQSIIYVNYGFMTVLQVQISKLLFKFAIEIELNPNELCDISIFRNWQSKNKQKQSYIIGLSIQKLILQIYVIMMKQMPYLPYHFQCFHSQKIIQYYESNFNLQYNNLCEKKIPFPNKLFYFKKKQIDQFEKNYLNQSKNKQNIDSFYAQLMKKCLQEVVYQSQSNYKRLYCSLLVRICMTHDKYVLPFTVYNILERLKKIEYYTENMINILKLVHELVMSANIRVLVLLQQELIIPLIDRFLKITQGGNTDNELQMSNYFIIWYKLIKAIIIKNNIQQNNYQHLNKFISRLQNNIIVQFGNKIQKKYQTVVSVQEIVNIFTYKFEIERQKNNVRIKIQEIDRNFGKIFVRTKIQYNNKLILLKKLDEKQKYTPKMKQKAITSSLEKKSYQNENFKSKLFRNSRSDVGQRIPQLGQSYSQNKFQKKQKKIEIITRKNTLREEYSNENKEIFSTGRIRTTQIQSTGSKKISSRLNEYQLQKIDIDEKFKVTNQTNESYSAINGSQNRQQKNSKIYKGMKNKLKRNILKDKNLLIRNQQLELGMITSNQKNKLKCVLYITTNVQYQRIQLTIIDTFWMHSKIISNAIKENVLSDLQYSITIMIQLQQDWVNQLHCSLLPYYHLKMQQSNNKKSSIKDKLPINICKFCKSRKLTDQEGIKLYQQNIKSINSNENMISNQIMRNYADLRKYFSNLIKIPSSMIKNNNFSKIKDIYVSLCQFKNQKILFCFSEETSEVMKVSMINIPTGRIHVMIQQYIALLC